MRTLTTIILIAISSLFSCKNSSQAMGADKIEPSNSGNAQETTYDMIISFISKGAGIDRDMRDKVDAALQSFNEKHKIDLNPEILGWGREGEVDYNFVAKNLSTSQKKELASKIKEVVGSSDMVHVVFNKKSVHKR